MKFDELLTVDKVVGLEKLPLESDNCILKTVDWLLYPSNFTFKSKLPPGQIELILTSLLGAKRACVFMDFTPNPNFINHISPPLNGPPPPL